MKISLCAIHSNPQFTPLALLYLKAQLFELKTLPEENVSIHEFHIKMDVGEILQELVAQDVSVFGFSCYVWNIEKVLFLSREIKRIKPGIKIVLGGPEVGPVARAIIQQHHHIDVVVKSEGEIVFPQIVSCWLAGESLASINGIAFREEGKIFDQSNAMILSDLNRLASPHNESLSSFEGRIICLETQRGCVFRCSFCFYNKDFSIRNRRFDLERVKGELLYWLNKDIAEIYLMDPIFNLNAKRAKEICRFIIDNKRRPVRFHTEIWAEFVDEELAELFQQAGFHYLEVGLQSANENILSLVDRKHRMQTFESGMKALRKFNLNVELQLIFGLPGETIQSFKTSIEMAESLNPSTISVFNLMVLPGTELWNKAEQLGLEYEKKPFYHVYKTATLTKEDFRYAATVIDFIGFLFQSKALKAMRKEAGFSLTQCLDYWFKYSTQNRNLHLSRMKRSEIGFEIRKFVSEVCQFNGLSEQFYLQILDFEFPIEKISHLSQFDTAETQPY